MRRALAFVVVTWMVVSACDKPCKPGYAKAGYDCKKLPESDAGMDGGVVLGSDGGAGEGMDGSAGECLPPECDPCAMNPCANGGACEPTERGYSCTCPIGFMGARCQIDPCELDPCLHDGVCKRVAEGRECAWSSDWTGATCETNTNPGLLSIAPSAGMLFPAFAPSTPNYAVDVGVGTSAVNLTVVAEQPEGVAIKIGDEVLASGVPSSALTLPLNAPRITSIVSTADDGSERSYFLTLRRTLHQQAYVKSSSVAKGRYFGGDEYGFGHGVSVHGSLLAVADSYAFDEKGSVRLFGRTGNVWGYSNALSHNQDGARFGAAVLVTATHLVAGAPGADQVRIYSRADLGQGSPSFALLQPPANTPATGMFGYGLAMAGETVFVGAPGALSEEIPPEIQPWSGEVHVFDREGEAWVWKQVITPPATDGEKDQPGLRFGAQIAAEGEVLVVGDPYSGKVFVYGKSLGTWSFDQKLDLGSDAATSVGGGAVGVSGGRIAVAETYLSVFGSTNFIGEPRLSVFERMDNEWRRTGTVLLPQVPNISGDRVANGFGTAGLAFDGSAIVVGAPQDRAPGRGVRTNSDVVSSEGSNAGAAYVFVESNAGWGQAAYVKASNAESDDAFGSAVALYGNSLVVAAPYEDSGENGDESDNQSVDSGAVYIFSVDCASLSPGQTVQSCE